MNLSDLYEISRKPRKAKSLFDHVREYIGRSKGTPEGEEQRGAGQGLGSWNRCRETSR
jgi:hypothetical protein